MLNIFKYMLNLFILYKCSQVIIQVTFSIASYLDLRQLMKKSNYKSKNYMYINNIYNHRPNKFKLFYQSYNQQMQ